MNSNFRLATDKDNKTYVSVSFYRERQYNETVYYVSVSPCVVDRMPNGINSISTMAFSGYKSELYRAKRASKGAANAADTYANLILGQMIDCVCDENNFKVTDKIPIIINMEY